jgi:hypothetical protein
MMLIYIKKEKKYISKRKKGANRPKIYFATVDPRRF